MPGYCFRFLVLALAILALAGGSHLARGGSVQPIITKLMVLEDATGELAIESVARNEDRNFNALQGGWSGGYSRSAHWFRFSIEAPAGDWVLDFLPSFLDQLCLYEADPAKPGRYIERCSGDLQPFSQREFDYRGFAFSVRKSDEHPRVFHVRMQTTSSSLLIPRVSSVRQFYATALAEQSLLLGIFGALLVVLLINLINWIWIRDPVQAWFLAYLLFVNVNFLANGGFLAQYLTPELPRVSDWLSSAIGLVTIATANAFYQRLLLVTRRDRVTYFLYRCGFWLPLAGLVGLMAGYFPEFMRVVIHLTLVINLLAFWLSWRLWRKKITSGGLLLLANLISMSGFLGIVANLTGYWYNSEGALFGLQISILGSVIAIHLAITQRIRQIQTQAGEAAREALSADARAKREESLRLQQSEFMAVLSHEVKTPLYIIDAAAQSLDLLIKGNPDVAKRSHRIRNAVARIDELITKLLQHDELDSRLSLKTRMELDFSELVSGVLEAYEDRTGRIVKEIERHIRVVGDAAKLRSLVGNLVENALKYSPESCAVKISLRRSEDLPQTAELDVVDSGQGVRTELRKRVFEKYVRGKHPGDVPGAGLGLYLVDTIAKLHGGQAMLLDSQSDCGAHFRITLPLASRK